MSCKYKKFDNPRYCQVINGECQFLKSPWDDKCPILENYKNYDKWWMEEQAKANNGTVNVDNIKSENSSQTTNLNIGK